MSLGEVDLLEANNELRTPFSRPLDYRITCSDRVKHLEAPLFFLAEGSSTWHYPLVFTLRTRRPAGRKRSEAKQQAYKDKSKA